MTSKAVLITGCSTGIGRSTAEALARAGYPVYATARNLDAIRDLQNVGCKILALDVCKEESMQAAVAQVVSEQGAVGILINNAGYGSEGPFEEVPMDEVRRQFETNVFGLIRMTQLVLPGMRQQRWGKVVNVSSVGGRMALPGGAFYHGTKWAVEAMSDSLRFEVTGFGIDVILIEPGAIRTNFGETAIEKIDASEPPNSPYREFRERLKFNIRDAYEGRMAKLSAGPEAVSSVIVQAVAAAKPKTRYPITFGAHFLIFLRRWLGDRGFDLFLRTQFPTPGR